MLGPDLLRQVDVRDLPAGVHPGVGPARDRQLDRGERVLAEPQHHAERVLQLPLHGPPPPLLGPAGEVLAVVAQVQPHPYEAGLHLVTHAADPLRMTKERARSPEGTGRHEPSSASGVLGLLSRGLLALGLGLLGLRFLDLGLGLVSLLLSLGALLGSRSLLGARGLGGTVLGGALGGGLGLTGSLLRTVRASTSSMTAMGALSPRRLPILVMRV